MVSEESKDIRAMVINEIAPQFNGTSLDVQRQALERMGEQIVLPETVRIESVTAGGVPAEWVFTSETASDEVVLYLHGGGLVMGSCRTHRGIASDFAASSGARVLLLDYRLAPENPPPAAIDDSVAAYRWLLSIGMNPENIVIAGDSAGGCLSIATLVELRDADDELPAAAILLSPMVDYAITGESVITRAESDPWITKRTLLDTSNWYCGDKDPKSPMISPLYADLRGMPPVYIIVGSDEIILSDSTRLADRLGNVGCSVTLEIWSGMWHVFQFFSANLPEGRQSIEKIGAFIRTHTRGASH